MKTKLLKNNIFRFDVEVIYSTKKHELEKQFKKHRLDIDFPDYDFDDFDWSFFYDNSLWLWFLFLCKKKPSVIAHEVLHIVTRLCKSCGIPISHENDETMAYLIWWYMEEITKITK